MMPRKNPANYFIQVKIKGDRNKDSSKAKTGLMANLTPCGYALDSIFLSRPPGAC